METYLNLKLSCDSVVADFTILKFCVWKYSSHFHKPCKLKHLFVVKIKQLTFWKEKSEVRKTNLLRFLRFLSILDEYGHGSKKSFRTLSRSDLKLGHLSEMDHSLDEYKKNSIIMLFRVSRVEGLVRPLLSKSRFWRGFSCCSALSMCVRSRVPQFFICIYLMTWAPVERKPEKGKISRQMNLWSAALAAPLPFLMENIYIKKILNYFFVFIGTTRARQFLKTNQRKK